MAENTKTPAAAPVYADDLNALAFDLYSKAMAVRPSNTPGTGIAEAAFRNAQAFIQVRARADKGELEIDAPVGPQLATCSAPNLPRTHPLNLVAAVFTDKRTNVEFPGDIKKVNRILKWLNENEPGKDETEDNIAAKLNAEFTECNWDGNAVATARVIFPAYALKN